MRIGRRRRRASRRRARLWCPGGRSTIGVVRARPASRPAGPSPLPGGATTDPSRAGLTRRLVGGAPEPSASRYSDPSPLEAFACTRTVPSGSTVRFRQSCGPFEPAPPTGSNPGATHPRMGATAGVTPSGVSAHRGQVLPGHRPQVGTSAQAGARPRTPRAEGVGFEPTEARRTSTAFEAVPFVRSGILPGRHAIAATRG
jgi:hypothetical protein